jgi:hypothetical protein
VRLPWIALLIVGCDGTTPPPTPTMIEDMEFSAYVDRDGDGLSGNDAPTQLRFSDYFASNSPGTKIIMVNASAGWCTSCMREAEALPFFLDDYQPRGVVVLTAIFQDQNGMPADAEFTKIWADTFMLSIPVLIDSTFATNKYFDASAMPTSMFVDAETLEILAITSGVEPGNDPLKAFRALLDSYLAQ